jgi:ABC-type phosphate transport system substrate-binding protein
MKMRPIILCFLGILLIFLFTDTPPARAAEILVIAHSSVPVERLEREAVAEIYLGTRTKWDDGAKIRVVMLKEGTTHETFVRDIVKTTPAKLRDVWKKVVFTGTGTPPKIVKTEADLVTFVAETRGAIGYIGAATPHEEVNVISLQE